MHRAGIVGATGYMGGEALRVLLEHPGVELAWATSRGSDEVARFHPNLYGAPIRLVHPDEAAPCDVVFLALPTAASIDAAAKFSGLGCRVIDLGAAFRLRDRETWEDVYGQEHPRWPLVEQAVYGIPELHRDAIRSARLVANPGCFSSAVILGLAPLLREGLVDPQRIVVDGLSGTAGIGAELSRPAHHPEIGANLIPYNAIAHRHTFEMEQELSVVAGESVSVHFTPTYVPIVRGILALCHVFPERSLSREALLELYRSAYPAGGFVQVYDLPPEEAGAWRYEPYPWVSAVAGTNFCQIGLDVDPRRGRIVVMSVLDSVGKGGAHVGVENMNLMLGLPPETGLTRRGLHP